MGREKEGGLFLPPRKMSSDPLPDAHSVFRLIGATMELGDSGGDSPDMSLLLSSPFLQTLTSLWGCRGCPQDLLSQWTSTLSTSSPASSAWTGVASVPSMWSGWPGRWIWPRCRSISPPSPSATWTGNDVPTVGGQRTPSC